MEHRKIPNSSLDLWLRKLGDRCDMFKNVFFPKMEPDQADSINFPDAMIELVHYHLSSTLQIWPKIYMRVSSPNFMYFWLP